MQCKHHLGCSAAPQQRQCMSLYLGSVSRKQVAEASGSDIHA